MNKTEQKHEAQERLLSAMQTAFSELSENDDISAIMSREMARVEKLFGYEPFSWMRGV